MARGDASSAAQSGGQGGASRFQWVLDFVAALVMIAAGVALIALAIAYWPSSGGGQAGPLPTEPESLAGAPTEGSDTARVALIIYADFQCPSCRSLALATLPQVKSNYVATGMLLVAFRHFPLRQFHPRAEAAAEAAECAAEQGRFWRMHDELFLQQASLDDASLIDRARAIGLDLG